MRRPSLLLCPTALALVVAAPALRAADEVKDAPSASQAVPLKLGSVDAVGGQVALRVPLGPALPGRIPVGFMWSLATASGLRSSQGGPNVGGSFRPVEWPEDISFSGSTLYTVLVNGEAWSFLPATRLPAASLPTVARLRSWMAGRHVNDGQAEALAYADGQAHLVHFVLDRLACASDGTRFYAVYHWDVDAHMSTGITVPAKSFPQRHVVLYGTSALGSDGPSRNVFTNTWGDAVTVEETGGFPGAPASITATNGAGQWVKLEVAVSTVVGYWTDGKGIVDSAATLTVSTSLPLPTATAQGRYRSKQRGTKSATNNPYRGIWDAGFLPTQITHWGDGQSRVTAFEWGNNTPIYLAPTRTADGDPGTTYPSVQGLPALPTKITHPEGIEERLAYGQLLDLGAFSFSNGLWQGFQPFDLTSDVPETIVGRLDKGVTEVKFADNRTNYGRAVRFVRKYPTCVQTGSVQQWPRKAHETYILNFPTDNPSSSTSYRGLKLVHPDGGSWGSGGVTPVVPDPANTQAFLFATSAILRAEAIHGSGTDAAGLPTSPQTDQTTVYDGWDLKSWANPDGSLAGAGRLGLPVTPVALRTVIYTPSLPTRTVLAGTALSPGVRDDRGPLRTDESTTAPAAAPATNPSAAAPWSGEVGSATSGAIHRRGQVVRHWNDDLLQLQTDSDTKTLDGTSLPSLRGAASVDFGTTTYGYDIRGRVTTVTGTRGALSAVETRTYVPNLPLVAETTKTLSGTAVSGAAAHGKIYGYDSSAHHWLTSETDKVDGRTTTYAPDALGRVTSTTDVLGITTTSTYDGWGRVKEVKRAATGGVGEVKTTTTYAVNGAWKQETVTAEGQSLTTRTDFDAWGRPVKVTFPDGSTQTTGYNGWGEKTWQSPVLRPGQTNYGNFTWTYDAQGRLATSSDRGGTRLLSEVVQQPAWGGVAGVTGVVTTVKDYAQVNPDNPTPTTRSTVKDYLGQTLAVVDQAGQASTYTYDKDGHLIGTLQGSQARSYTYNDLGWLTSRTEPEEGRTDFQNHTMLGVPTKTVQKGRDGAQNTVTTVTLNAWDLPASVSTTGLGGAVTRTYTYNGITHLPTTVQEVQAYGTLTETYGYDGLLRLNSKSVSDGVQTFMISRTLDAAGNLKQLAYPAGGGRPVSYLDIAYDTLLRPVSATMGGQLRASMDYGAAAGTAVTTTLTYGNGATTRSTTDSGELVRVVHAGSDYSQGVAMTWTPGGLLRRREDTANPAVADTFRYDALQRLVGATTIGLNGTDRMDQTFTYDRWGNRIATTATYTGDPLNKPAEALSWTAANTTSLAATNSLPTSVTGPGGIPLFTNAQYDKLGRITMAYAIPGNLGSGVGWGYDASGRVIGEGSDKFLLDAEGLRFKRIRTNKSQVYTVYGFAREPLAVFETGAGSEPLAPGERTEGVAPSSNRRSTSRRGSGPKGGGR